MVKSSPAAFAVAVLLLVSSALQAQSAGADQGAGKPSTVESNADQPPGQATDQPIVEKVRRLVEKNPVARKLEGDGFYPKVGGLTAGSGLAGGVGYRRHLSGVYVDLAALASMKAYRGIDAKARWLQTPGKTFEVWTDVRYRNDTQDDFYGLGIDSTNATRADFGISTTDLVTRAAARVRPWLELGADIGYFMPSVRHGRDDHIRSIEQIFTDVTAPGLARQPDFLHDSVFAEIDSRDARGFPRRGGVYGARYALWNDRTFDEFDFRRFDIEGSQFFGVSRSDVLALRLDLSYANNAPGGRVPFYLLPYVGGGDTVRAFREFRFRDENAGVFSAELRHRVHPLAHVALFVDAGKVANDWQDINPTNLKKAYGFGFRAGNDDRVFLRFDVAFGDGTRVFLKFAPAF